jgi:hypothetical protein
LVAELNGRSLALSKLVHRDPPPLFFVKSTSFPLTEIACTTFRMPLNIIPIGQTHAKLEEINNKRQGNPKIDDFLLICSNRTNQYKSCLLHNNKNSHRKLSQQFFQ